MSAPEARPAQPAKDRVAWYRGWEAGYDQEAGFWTSSGWRAYKGGCDIDAPHVDAKTWSELLDAIDEEEDE